MYIDWRYFERLLFFTQKSIIISIISSFLNIKMKAKKGDLLLKLAKKNQEMVVESSATSAK